ncbi:C6 zinc finger domain-containing protein [Colletotrichum chrysophilum]|uniref:C6 zinc finger domain-containing protein n=1 Tax=Colletotrichum chrysophilum TaxID=1836956 RepID=A0AAD9AJX0_9PEZI|nr:C6 zinc finger domain-containing protein [Colletotrichum chrysophilum]
MPDNRLEDPPSENGPRPKKRKIRKGTTSCWECKKRKIRCQFASASHEICEGCERRGTACLTQEYDNETTDQRGAETSKHKETEERLKRAEELLERMMDAATRLTPATESLVPPGGQSPVYVHKERQLSSKFLSQSASPSSCPSIQVFDSTLVDEGVDLPDNLGQGPPQTRQDRYQNLCTQLHEAMPTQREANFIISAGHTAAFLQFFTLPYRDLFSGNMRPSSSLSALPDQSDHPVLLARTLLYLANGLQNLHPSTLNTHLLNLDRPLEAMIGFIHAASLVTKDDELICSLEGLECLILEAVFYTNTGKLRQAWLIIKRAVGHAQLLGLHRKQPKSYVILDPMSKASPSIMWHRIVSQDRYLSLMLGLPATTASYASPEVAFVPGECPSEYLERAHSTLMGRIAARNDEDQDIHDLSITQSIDRTIQEAAQSIPPEWWFLPNTRNKNMPAEPDGSQTLEGILRVLLQITHYNLLILLHLPCMLRPSGESTHNYSKVACVNASRELLSRYIKFRCMNHNAFCCRSIDFSAFTACLAFVLAHIERWRRGTEAVDFLAHQRLSDRAVVEEAVELFLEVNESSSDGLLEHTASILRSLLDMEADAAAQATSPVDLIAAETRHSRRCLYLKIPYFGALTITRHGISSKSASVASSYLTPYATDGDLGNTDFRISHQQYFLSDGTSSLGSAFLPNDSEQSNLYSGLPANPEDWLLYPHDGGHIGEDTTCPSAEVNTDVPEVLAYSWP